MALPRGSTCIPLVLLSNLALSLQKLVINVPGKAVQVGRVSTEVAFNSGSHTETMLYTDRIVSSVQATTSRCPVARPVVDVPRRVSRSCTSDIHCGGLKKQTKKLAKTLKTHRKRLESMLASAVTSPEATSQLQLQAVLQEMAQLQDALQSIRSLQEQQAQCLESSSSDSDSECESEPRIKRYNAAGVSRSSMVVAAAAACSIVLEPPAVDEELPSVVQQLPPPQPLEGKGRILVCQGKACMGKGALQVLQAASHATAASPGIDVIPCKCLGKCKQGPAVRLRNEQPGCTLLTQVSPLEVSDAVQQAFSSSVTASKWQVSEAHHASSSIAAT